VNRIATRAALVGGACGVVAFGTLSLRPHAGIDELQAAARVAETRAAAPVTVQLSSLGGYRVSYSAEPAPIPLNEPFELGLHVDRVAGPALRAVNVRAEMPEHSHGMNTETVMHRRAPDGYVAQGMLLHMAGRWSMLVDLHRADGIIERAAFDVAVE